MKSLKDIIIEKLVIGKNIIHKKTNISIEDVLAYLNNEMNSFIGLPTSNLWGQDEFFESHWNNLPDIKITPQMYYMTKPVFNLKEAQQFSKKLKGFDNYVIKTDVYGPLNGKSTYSIILIYDYLKNNKIENYEKF